MEVDGAIASGCLKTDNVAMFDRIGTDFIGKDNGRGQLFHVSS